MLQYLPAASLHHLKLSVRHLKLSQFFSLQQADEGQQSSYLREHKTTESAHGDAGRPIAEAQSKCCDKEDLEKAQSLQGL